MHSRANVRKVVEVPASFLRDAQPPADRRGPDRPARQGDALTQPSGAPARLTPADHDAIERYAGAVVDAADGITHSTGGRRPERARDK